MSRGGTPTMLSKLISLLGPLKSGQLWSNPVPTEMNRKLFLTSLQEQWAQLPRAQSQANAETIYLKVRKEMPNASPSRNVKHVWKRQRAFVKEAAICAVDAREMLSPPTWAWGFSCKARWLSFREATIRVEGDAHIPAATRFSGSCHGSPLWKGKQVFSASLWISTVLPDAR